MLNLLKSELRLTAKERDIKYYKSMSKYKLVGAFNKLEPKKKKKNSRKSVFKSKREKVKKSLMKPSKKKILKSKLKEIKEIL